MTPIKERSRHPERVTTPPIIPGPPQQPQEPNAPFASPPLLPHQTYYQQPQYPPPHAPKKKGLSTGAILGIVFGSIAAVGVAVLFICSAGSFFITRSSHAGDSDVTIESCDVSSGGLATADLRVKNSASITANYIITVEFTDGSTRVGQDKAYVNDLRPGQEARTTATALVPRSGASKCQVVDVARI